MILKVRGVEVGSKHRSKIHQKKHVNMRRHLGLDFSSMLVDISSISPHLFDICRFDLAPPEELRKSVVSKLLFASLSFISSR